MLDFHLMPYKVQALRWRVRQLLASDDGVWSSIQERKERIGVMLEGIDTELIERTIQVNTEFRHLLDEHQKYEEQLTSFASLRYLTTEQEIERKRLQKLKLQGKDRMLAILRQYQ
jgi:uncharacterized protein